MSPAKIEANRQNATLSTGPTSPEGKATSSRNAISHGLTARHAVLPTENVADYEEFVADLIDQYRPGNRLHHALVKDFANVTWRLRRVHVIEAQTLNREMLAIAEEPENAQRDSYVILSMAYERLIERKVITNLHAQECRLNSRMYKILNQLTGIEQIRQRHAANRPAPYQFPTAPTPTPPQQQQPEAAPEPEEIEICKSEPIHVVPQPGRNEICPCASGLKFKRCCLNRPNPAKTLAAAA